MKPNRSIDNEALMTTNPRNSPLIRHPSAFTLVELLVVIGIIGVLAAILFPVISKVRTAAQETDSRALIVSIEGACQAYHQDFGAYPGPFSSIQLAGDLSTSGKQPPVYYATSMGTGLAGTLINDGTATAAGVITGPRITGTENAVLGLMGGLVIDTAVTPNRLAYEQDSVGKGAIGLNALRRTSTPPYIQTGAVQLSKLATGAGAQNHFVDWSGTSNPTKDSVIPEFVDKFPSPMPILVLRARINGKASVATTAVTDKNNNVVINAPYSGADPNTLSAQYNLIEITPYTQSSIGANPEVGAARTLAATDYKGVTFNPNLPHGLTGIDPMLGKSINKNIVAEYQYPYEAFSYLADPATYDYAAAAATNKGLKKARKADTLILISAGKDRVYGTNDDITNFGTVLP